MNMCVPLILQLMILQLANSQFPSNGGPSAFGYDASSACSKPYSRNARAYLEKIPCDFRRQNWCAVAGNFYPWHAVKRFVKENQGLMRRMYGDEKHISVLKSELEKNDIELEFDDRHGRSYEDYRSFLYDDDDEFEEEQKPSGNSQARGFNDKLSEVEDITTSSAEITTSSSTTSFVTSESTLTSTEIPPTTPENLSTKLTMFTTLTKATENTNKTTENVNTLDKILVTSTLVLSEIARVKNSSINEIPGLLMETVDDTDVFNMTNTPNIIEETTIAAEGISTFSTLSTIDRIDENTEEMASDKSEQLVFAASAENKIHEQFRPRPEYRPTEIKGDISKIQGQLFQEVAAKDKVEPPVLKLRGVNACPVKEEVVAPFWANNTRGEVLALLNLYPFEQYVHWEKCTHPKKQMYCREGCRCEQQYRLHRLLAYDPNNECRGIFSDWFKFPSCCVCRCYDLPLEFRVTSRSPRAHKQKLKLKPPANRWT